MECSLLQDKILVNAGKRISGLRKTATTPTTDQSSPVLGFEASRICVCIPLRHHACFEATSTTGVPLQKTLNGRLIEVGLPDALCNQAIPNEGTLPCSSCGCVSRW